MKVIPKRNIPSRIAGVQCFEGAQIDLDADVAKALEEKGLVVSAPTPKAKPKRKSKTSDSSESRPEESQVKGDLLDE